MKVVVVEPTKKPEVREIGSGLAAMQAVVGGLIEAVYPFDNAAVKPLSPKSVKCIHGVLHEALDQAVANGELAANPTSTCKLPKVEKREFVALESSQVSTFLDAIEGHTHEYLFKIALFTGLRQGELLGLTWDCMDGTRSTSTGNKHKNQAREFVSSLG